MRHKQYRLYKYCNNFLGIFLITSWRETFSGVITQTGGLTANGGPLKPANMILLILLTLLGGPENASYRSPIQKVAVVEQKEDQRIAKLEVALKGTLLEGQESVFVEVADKYDFDYRLLSAIAFSESGLCDRFITSTCNCWGWGGGKIAFKSFEEAIRTIGFKLATLPYYEAWRKDKSNLTTLAQTYCQGDNEHWVSKINYFYNKL